MEDGREERTEATQITCILCKIIMNVQRVGDIKWFSYNLKSFTPLNHSILTDGRYIKKISDYPQIIYATKIFLILFYVYVNFLYTKL